MTNRDDKRFFIEAYFASFRDRVKRFDTLLNDSYVEEAWILCVVYLDQLASGLFYDGRERSKENFCKALSDYSLDPFFSSIHPGQFLAGLRLLDENRKTGGIFECALAEIIHASPNQFLNPDAVTQAVRRSSLSKTDQDSVTTNLWKASVAAICYESIRCQAVHGPGSSHPLTFDATAYEASGGSTINFGRLRNALENVLGAVERLSLETNEWFGNPKFK